MLGSPRPRNWYPRAGTKPSPQLRKVAHTPEAQIRKTNLGHSRCLPDEDPGVVKTSRLRAAGIRDELVSNRPRAFLIQPTEPAARNGGFAFGLNVTKLCDLIDMTTAGSKSAAPARDPFAWHPPKITSRRLPRRGCLQPRRRAGKKRPAWVQRDRQHAVTLLAQADHRRLFKQVSRACRAVVGRCFQRTIITPEQREQIIAHAWESTRRDEIRVTLKQLAARVDFWLSVYDPSKALWFTIYDVAQLAQVIASRLPTAHLCTVNQRHMDQLDGRVIDYTTLAYVGVAVAKNSLVGNRKTRLEECGTSSLIEMLRSVGISANGTLIRVCREILGSLGLIRCTDSTYFTKGMYGPGKCQKWVPCGATWSLPFLEEIRRDELTDAQREEYDRHHARQDDEVVSSVEDCHSMLSERSFPIPFIIPSHVPSPDPLTLQAPSTAQTYPAQQWFIAMVPILSGSTAHVPSVDQRVGASAPAEPTIDAAAHDWDGTPGVHDWED